MIGDCNPHEPGYPQNKLKLNWRDEADELGRMGVRIYSVQCGSITQFYKSIADRTGGKHLKLKQFQNIFDFIMAVCYREKGGDFLDSYEKEVRARYGPVHKDLHQLFVDLRDTDPSTAPVKGAKPKSVRRTRSEGASKVSTIEAKSPALRAMKRKALRAKGWDKMKLSRAVNAYSEDKLRRLNRENVPQTNFMLRDLSWSPWKFVIGPESPAGENWRKRNGDGCGYRTPVIFNGGTKLPALYEVAVLPKNRTNKIVVFCKTCKGFTDKSNWEKSLLGRKDITTQIDAVVKQNCQVYIRRTVLKTTKAQEKVKPAMKRYDYAWKCISSIRKCHRDCTIKSVRISDDSFSL